MFFSGDKLKDARQSSFNTIDNLVQALESQYNLKINKGMVSRWENGKATPRDETIKILAQCLSVPIDHLSESDTTDKDIALQEAMQRIEELEAIKEMYLGANNALLNEIELYKLQEARLLLQLQTQQEQIRELKKISRVTKYFEMAEENLKMATELDRLKRKAE